MHGIHASGGLTNHPAGDGLARPEKTKFRKKVKVQKLFFRRTFCRISVRQKKKISTHILVSFCAPEKVANSGRLKGGVSERQELHEYGRLLTGVCPPLRWCHLFAIRSGEERGGDMTYINIHPSLPLSLCLSIIPLPAALSVMTAAVERSSHFTPPQPTQRTSKSRQRAAGETPHPIHGLDPIHADRQTDRQTDHPPDRQTPHPKREKTKRLPD